MTALLSRLNIDVTVDVAVMVGVDDAEVASGGVGGVGGKASSSEGGGGGLFGGGIDDGDTAE